MHKNRFVDMLAWAALAVLAVGGAHAHPAPVLRFAIDQDYYPGRQSVARVADDFKLARFLSVDIIRTGIGWDDTNPRPDHFQWGFWNRVIASAHQSGIAIMPYYAYTPAWAAPAYNDPPAKMADFGRACSVMAATIGAAVPSLEIWNEPDNTAFWTGSPHRYGDALNACGAAVRDVAGAPPLVLGGLVYLDSAWLAHTGNAAGSGYDFAAFHEYSETPWAPITVEQINSPADFSQGYDGLSQNGAVPVWMNEGGASTNARLGYSEQSQASWIRRTVASVIGHPGRPVSLFGLYQLRDLDPTLSKPIGDKVAREFFLHTGIFTIDGRPKLAAATYGDLVRLLDKHRLTLQAGVTYSPTRGRTSRLFRLYAWRLETGRQVIMVWDRTKSLAGRIMLSTPGHAAFLHRADGSIVKLARFDGTDIEVPKLAAGGMPLLFEVE